MPCKVLYAILDEVFDAPDQGASGSMSSSGRPRGPQSETAVTSGLPPQTTGPQSSTEGPQALLLCSAKEG